MRTRVAILIAGCRYLIGVLLLCLSSASADDTTRVPIDQIPKLSESFQTIDYRDLLAGGTLFPDRITWDSITIRTGHSEDHISASLSDSIDADVKEELRTREQQWASLRSLLYRNNYSMHYYILAGLYYDQQLYGWFKTYEWRVDGAGVIRVHLNRPDEAGRYRVWLIELSLDSIPPDSVRFKAPPALTLIRDCAPVIEWNPVNNRIIIGRHETTSDD